MVNWNNLEDRLEIYELLDDLRDAKVLPDIPIHVIITAKFTSSLVIKVLTFLTA